MKAKICTGCHKTKNIEEFSTKGRQVDKEGKPLYRSQCKVCCSKKKLNEYYEKKEILQNSHSESIPIKAPTPIVFEVEDNSFSPNHFLNRKQTSPAQPFDFIPWEKAKGQPLTEEEQMAVKSNAKDLIGCLLDLVIFQKASNKNHPEQSAQEEIKTENLE